MVWSWLINKTADGSDSSSEGTSYILIAIETWWKASCLTKSIQMLSNVTNFMYLPQRKTQ